MTTDALELVIVGLSRVYPLGVDNKSLPYTIHNHHDSGPIMSQLTN